MTGNSRNRAALDSATLNSAARQIVGLGNRPTPPASLASCGRRWERGGELGTAGRNHAERLFPLMSRNFIDGFETLDFDGLFG